MCLLESAMFLPIFINQQNSLKKQQFASRLKKEYFKLYLLLNEALI